MCCSVDAIVLQCVAVSQHYRVAVHCSNTTLRCRSALHCRSTLVVCAVSFIFVSVWCSIHLFDKTSSSFNRPSMRHTRNEISDNAAGSCVCEHIILWRSIHIYIAHLFNRPWMRTTRNDISDNTAGSCVCVHITLCRSAYLYCTFLTHPPMYSLMHEISNIAAGS